MLSMYDLLVDIHVLRESQQVTRFKRISLAGGHVISIIAYKFLSKIVSKIHDDTYLSLSA